MPRYHQGREELGQNFLVHSKYKSTLARSALSQGLPVVELAAGDGAISTLLARQCRSLTLVEIDPRRAHNLRRQFGRRVEIVEADLLDFMLPSRPHSIVANLPFHLTTAALKRLLAAPHWQHATLLVQWEVARRRAGVGGASMLTVMWQPWFEFDLLCRVPARAFRPTPSVDGGIFTAERRAVPLVDHRGRYQRFVKSVFSAPGSTLDEKLARSGRLPRKQAKSLLRKRGLPVQVRPRDLDVLDWVELFDRVRSGNP